MNSKPPIVVVLAGPNGAGKSTAADSILREDLAVSEFVNADVIARGLSGFEPEKVAMAAGRIMLERLDALANQRADFSFETTLASRTFAPWLGQLRRDGYEFHLCFLWLPNPESAIARVAARVRAGGHDIPIDSIRRRYVRGIKNLFELYMPIATHWTVMNTAGPFPMRIASGGTAARTQVPDSSTWAELGARSDES